MPEAAVRLARGERYTVRGVAYAGARGVRAVECSVDGGGRWGVAQLDYVGSSLTWVPWSYEWSPQSTGTHELVDRATDGEGRPQTVNERWIVP